MEAGGWLVIIAAASFAAVCGGLLGPGLLEVPTKLKRRAVVKERISSQPRPGTRGVALSLLVFISQARAGGERGTEKLEAGTALAGLPVIDKLTGLLRRAGMQACAEDIVATSMVAAIAASGCVLLLGGNAAMAAAAGLAAPSLLYIEASREAKRRQHLLREQLPSALRAIGMSLAAGHSLQQAFGHAAASSSDPLSQEMLQLVWDIDAGKGVDEAIEALRVRTSIVELAFVSVACSVQHRSGGSLSEVLDAASRSVKSSLEMERSLEVQTAQARLSARVVAIMPLVLFATLVAASPGYLEDLVGSPAGLAMLAGALGLDLAGLFLIRRVLAIDM